ncbi:MAG: tRNA lysidine(34) synthetase TilS [Rhodopseudomonas sp.]|nr:tRNA lysidine(34) synthetase TilS [Rhodopseudomonas sp.]
MADPATPVSLAEVRQLFFDLDDAPALLLAVSGGPDSTALMVLAARWAKSLRRKPKLVAVTVDHGLRPESKAEAQAVALLARRLGVTHRTLRWTGAKPKAGLPRAARDARYRLLAQAAVKAGARHILTAHTLDDQAETVMIRMMRGSGITGLAAMGRTSPVPGGGGVDCRLVRPLLDLPKLRLIATLTAADIGYADDPTNRDATFTRARLRQLMPVLAGEGLGAGRLALLARRLRRADRAIEAAVDRAMAGLGLPEDETGGRRGPVRFALDAGAFIALPAEVGLRLVGRLVARVGLEGPVELAKLEAMVAALDAAQNTGSRFRRSLAGAIVTFVMDRKRQNGQITVERAPPRRQTGIKSLTKGRVGAARGRKKR